LFKRLFFFAVIHVANQPDMDSRKMEKPSSVTEKTMSAVMEARHLVRSLAAPAWVDDSIKAQISRAARRIPFWSYRRVKSVWYGETSSIDADDFEALKRLAKMDQEANDASSDYARLEARLFRLEETILLSATHMDRAPICEGRPLDARSGGEDRAMD
jgi:hypothetical protein